MNLVIVESPTKAKTLRKYLGPEYAIEASMGHIRDLPKSKIGIDIAHDFTPEYVKSEGKTQVITKLKKLSKDAKKIFLATDPDREGEAISWHIKSLLEDGAKSKKEKTELDTKFARATFHEITKDAIVHAIEHPSTLNMALVDAQQARRVLDRLVGYYLSPVLWKKVRRGLSAGRVQSVALRLIVEREKEREVFVPQEYWEILVTTTDATNAQLVIELYQLNGKAFTAVSKEQADPIIANLPDCTYTITSVESNKRIKGPNAPFTTSTLQQAGANRLGFTSKRTMKLAQDLYEQGLITYHRTDSVNLSTSAVDAARALITSELGQQYLSGESRTFKTKSKNAQEAHEAIRPTDVHKKSVQGHPSLDESHQKLYDLIWRRFVATQMADAVYEQTAVLVDAKKEGSDTYGLKANGSVLIFDGWTKYFPASDDVILPKLSVGQKLTYKDIQALQKFTQPPARYNDASLVKQLEKLGIGRPSTYASIINVLEVRAYVTREAKTFVPTAIGRTVSDFLVQNFPTELDYGFTAAMEDDLDAISRGEKAWVKVLRAFFGPFETKVRSVSEEAARAVVPVEEFGAPCPKCKEGKLVIRTGRFGKFVSCNRYPECDFTGKLIFVVKDFACPDCGEGQVREKNSKRGKFYGCSRYPSCRYTSWQKPGTEANPVEMQYIPNTPKPKEEKPEK